MHSTGFIIENISEQQSRGLDPKIVNWIQNFLSDCWYSIVLEGDTGGNGSVVLQMMSSNRVTKTSKQSVIKVGLSNIFKNYINFRFIMGKT
jgi:hypothetical protein